MASVSSEKLKKRIKEILRDADLSTLSAKKVRLKLQESFEADLSERKKEIDKMTMKLIVEMEEKKAKEEEEKQQADDDDDNDGGSDDDEKNGKSEEEEPEEEEPPKKKVKSKQSKKKKRQDSNVDEEDLEPLENDDLNVYDEEQKTLKLSDEELAKRLQSFEETGRRTRGRAVTKKKEKRKGGGGGTYSRPCLLSADLATIMGTDKLARNEVVKKMWEIVKERKLQDPKDKRFMICDEQLLKVFGRKRVQTFGMMKYLSSHIKDEGSSLESVITNSDIYDDEADDD